MPYIFFDLDGTLTDPKIGITKSVQYALKKCGITVENTDDLCHFIGPPLKDSFKKFYGFGDDDAENAVTFYREYFSEKGIYENAIYDGAREMLQMLKASQKTLVLATSKPTVYATKILKHFNIYEYFTFISGSELDGSRSKKSEVIRYALEQNNISDLSGIIMVGDREHDIIGAKSVGILSIGVYLVTVIMMNYKRQERIL
jgi:haloacid dehalogenase superfamily, subfamily IA, variant 1 with third motif having Dx(3-4)D or Dx(3-4)E